MQPIAEFYRHRRAIKIISAAARFERIIKKRRADTYISVAARGCIVRRRQQNHADRQPHQIFHMHNVHNYSFEKENCNASCRQEIFTIPPRRSLPNNNSSANFALISRSTTRRNGRAPSAAS